METLYSISQYLRIVRHYKIYLALLYTLIRLIFY